MRELAEPLLRAQKGNTIRAAVRLEIGDFIFTHNKTETCHNTDAGLVWSSIGGGRIMEVTQVEEPFKQTTKIILNNWDKLLNDIKFKGSRCYVSWGAITEDGEFYSTTGVQFVNDQTMISAQGTLQCILNCAGPMNFMGKDQALVEFKATGTETTGALITGTLAATLDPFDGCKEFNLVYDNPILSSTDLWSVVLPGESFVIKKAETRLNVLARLLDMTSVYIKPGSEAPDSDGSDTLHLFTLNPSSQYTYSLKSYDHRFYVDSRYDGILLPNEIIIKSDTSEAAYIGKAKDIRSYNAFPCTRTEYVSGLINDHQAVLIAQAILANIANAQDATSAILPMNCGQEIFDRITIEDGRSGTTLVGVVGHIERVFQPMEKEPKYLMNVSFGKWYDPRKAAEIMGIGSGFIDNDPVEILGGGGHISINELLPYDISGGWVGFYLAGVLVAYAIANNDWIEYKANLNAGEYLLAWLAWKSTTACIQDIDLDDTEIISFDNYTASLGWHHRSTLLTIETSGVHSIKFRTHGKNAGNVSPYYTQANGKISIVNYSLVGTPLMVLIG